MCDLVLVLSQVLFVDKRFKDEELHKDSSSFARVSTSSGTISPFYLSRVIGCASWPLSQASFSRSRLFRFGPITGHSRIVSARLDLATPSSVLLVPLTFSPCLDASRELIFWRLVHRNARHRDCLGRIRRGMGDRRSSR